LAVGAESRYDVYSVGDWKLLRRIKGDPSVNYAGMACSPDGRMLAIRCSATEVQLVNPIEGREFARLPGNKPTPLCFNADGTLLAVSDAIGLVKLWDLRLVREELVRFKLDWELPPYSPRADSPPSRPLRINILSNPPVSGSE
jgi:hypothetical protein